MGTPHQLIPSASPSLTLTLFLRALAWTPILPSGPKVPPEESIISQFHPGTIILPQDLELAPAFHEQGARPTVLPEHATTLPGVSPMLTALSYCQTQTATCPIPTGRHTVLLADLLKEFRTTRYQLIFIKVLNSSVG